MIEPSHPPLHRNRRPHELTVPAATFTRATFSVRDHDDYADWPEFNVFSAQDHDTPAFVTLHFIE